MLNNKNSKPLFLLSLILLFSFLCISSMKSFAEELNPLVDTVKEQIIDIIDPNIIDKEIIYPAMPLTETGNLEDTGVYTKHVIHMPKKEVDISKPSTIPIDDFKPTTEANVSEIIEEPTVSDSVYNEFNPEDYFLKYEYIDTSTVSDVVYGESKKDNIKNDNRTVSDQVYGDFPIKNKKGLYTAGFSPKSGKNYLQFSYGDSSIYFNPINSNSVVGDVYENTITYKNIYPSTDIRYTLEQSRLKEDIIVQKYTGKNEFYFQLDLNNINHETKSNGEIHFTKSETGDHLFYFAKPYAFDSAGNLCESISMQFNEEGSLVITVDPEWLKKAVYPITIDPSIWLTCSEIYQASSGFSGTQDPWYYKAYEYGGGFHNLIWNSYINQWEECEGCEDDAEIGSNWQWPGVYDSVRIWEAPHAGRINISGNVRMAQYTGAGDGVYVKIMRSDTVQIWPSSGWQRINANNTAGVNFNFNVDVSEGTMIRFFVNCYEQGDFTNDKVIWDPVISYYYDTYNTPYGTGSEAYWNYISSGLGNGWNNSVNTYNLNMLLNKPLFQVPGRGLAIGESITYNSIDGRIGTLGEGWHLGNDVKVTERSDGSVLYTEGDGSSHIFTLNPDGTYKKPPGIYLTLTKESGLFKITDKKQNVFDFNASGKLSQGTDRNGNITSFTYDANGRLWKAIDPSGREIVHNYNQSGQLSSVVAPDQNSYQFAYMNGLLTSVTDPLNNAVTFAYDANGYLNSFTDFLSQVTSFTYNSDGQVQSFRDARTNGTDIYQTSFTQALQSGAYVTTVTDPGSRVYTYYHNLGPGNLTNFTDQLGHSWVYSWSNNNMMSSQDSNGKTSYGYDSKGNVNYIRTTVDNNTANDIIETMTYDDYSELLQYVDGSGKATSYRYSNKGELLSTFNEGIKESNGSKYDSYGNVVEYSPQISNTHNSVKNGSMEILGSGGNLLEDWTRTAGAATATLEGFNSHGNSALKLNSSSPTTDLFCQRVNNVNIGNKITLRADVKLDNVQYTGTDGGAIIKLDYGDGNYEQWFAWGSGILPMVVTSEVPNDNDYVDVYVGLSNASGIVWFDGIQIEKVIDSDDGYTLSGFNSIENSSFEGSLRSWSYTGSTPTVSLEEWAGTRSIKLTGTSTIYQDVSVYSGEPLTLSGMVETCGVTGTGAYLEVEYYDTNNSLISTIQTGYITGTHDYTRLSSKANAPTGSARARVKVVKTGSGYAYIDLVKLVPNNSETYTYNASGNYLINSEDALGNQSSYTYNNNNGNLLTYTDPLSRTTTYGYDNLDRLVEVTDPLLHHSYYDYNSVGYLSATRDPRSSSSSDNTYRTIYDPNQLNILDTLTDPSNRDTSYLYDRSRNLTKITLPNSLELNYEYDNANRLTKKTLDGGKYFSYAYDSSNYLLTVTDQDSIKYYYTYDRAGRVKTTKDNFNLTLTYAWDKSNNLTSLTGTSDIQYGYNSANKLTSITFSGSNINYNYDENGRLFYIEYPDDNYRYISYLPNGWCNRIQDTLFPGRYRFDYSYYDNGNISNINSWAGDENFVYDGNNRLTSWALTARAGSGVTSASENYSYDAAGNLTSKGSQSFTYNNSNQITNSGFTYDNNGNLTSDGTLKYEYNAENRLTVVRRVSDNSIVATYSYNYDGLRKSKTVNGVTTNYNWDKFGRLVRETGGRNIQYYYDTNDNLVGLRTNYQNYTVHTNLRGDVVSIADASGNILAQYHYDPWGNQIAYSGTLSQSFRYAGYYYDQETGLYYCKNRYYSPSLGRFLTKDSTNHINYSDPQTLNLNTYAENDPVGMVDPTGSIAIADDTVAFLAGLAVIAGLTIAANLGNERAARSREALVESCRNSIARLREKAETATGPPGVQYSLRATVSGDYYLNVRTLEPVHLESGDVWKYGETTNADGRYSKEWLEGSNLRFVPEYYGNQLQIKIVEREKLLEYVLKNGNLPPGNKICR